MFNKLKYYLLAFGVFFALWFAHASAASIVFDSVSNAGYSNGSSQTWTHTATSTGANCILLVAAGSQNNSASVTATVNGNAMTQIATNMQGTNARIAGFYYKNPPSGSETIVTTFSSGGADMKGASRTYCNVDQTNPIDASAV